MTIRKMKCEYFRRVCSDCNGYGIIRKRNPSYNRKRIVCISYVPKEKKLEKVVREGELR